MKRLILMICLLSAMLGYAQDLTVKSIEPNPTDLTAATNSRKDFSGQTCALVKVNLPVPGVTFDGDVIGDVSFNGSEYQVYLSPGSKILEISCPGQSSMLINLKDYGVDGVKSNVTYVMDMMLPTLLKEGKYVKIITIPSEAEVTIDDRNVGLSPINSYYLPNGKHVITATKGKMEATEEIVINNNGGDATQTMTVQLRDVADFFGKVIIQTDPEAEIILNGKSLGQGQWIGELRQGEYVIETSKANCENATTVIKVTPRTTETIQAKSPVPFTGFLQIIPTPASAHVTVDGNIPTQIDRIELPIGTHSVVVRSKGYTTKQKQVEIEHNRMVSEVISLDRIKYFKSSGVYVGAAYTISPFSGVTAVAGGVFSNIDVQIGYTFGLNKTDIVTMYSADGEIYGRAQYTGNTLEAKLGYQIVPVPNFAIVPQVGYLITKLSGTLVSGKLSGDGAVSNLASVGVRAMYAPIQHLSLFVAPEYAFAVKNDAMYDKVINASGVAKNQFICHVGLMVNF